MSRHISPATTLDTLKQEAKRWRRGLVAGEPEAWERWRRTRGAGLADAGASSPNPETRTSSPTPPLRAVQHALAREYGFAGWAALKRRIENAALTRYEAVADALVTAYRTPDPAAMRMVWDYFGHRRAWEGMRRYIRLDLGGPEEVTNPDEDFITLAQARHLVARGQGFPAWETLVAFTEAIPPGQPILPKQVGAYFAGDTSPLETATTVLSRNWDDLLAAARDRRLSAIHAGGQMTDDVLERLSHFEQIEELDLDASRGITDEGLRHLARLPKLRNINLGGCAIGDPGLQALGRVSSLERIALPGTRVTDGGIAHLAGCRALRVVDLSGTRTGDGAIRALAGKPSLRHFRSGEEVTDAGLALFREYPAFRSWTGDEAPLHLFSYDDHPNLLQLRGRFTDAGLASLAECEGLYALNLDSNRLAVTGAGLAPLAALPHFSALSFDAKDADMPYIAALPRLRHLVCQDTIAGDDGFAALGASRSLEHLWGRRCHNLRRRGFAALANIPTLRSLSVSCLNVDDEGLAALPGFPALTELMPMDVADEGYRFIAQCPRIESLVLMYCRETGDRATEHIAGMRLKKYFASYNRITDRTPELLSGMETLEAITFDSCAGLTNAGIAALARLPRLRSLGISGMRGVTREVSAAFEPGVKVRYGP
ncbi:MAG TPA: hypothetical protein VFT04_00785 [Gemmatimonadales bacterium]|nr:hypothetical protein [Gemmatimonadales bacterium]